MSQSFANRFWSKVDVRDAGACWEWRASGTNDGYGQIRPAANLRQPGKILAHRAAWELAHGPIPDGMYCLHRCDNPGCVNPAHLFLGTNDDNMADRQAKGRQARGEILSQPGERNPSSRLTEQQVRELRAARAGGASLAQLSERFGIHYQTAYRVAKGLLWPHIEGETAAGLRKLLEAKDCAVRAALFRAPKSTEETMSEEQKEPR